MRLTVTSKFAHAHNCWNCFDGTDYRIVDLTLHNKKLEITPGCIVEIERLTPYIEIAHGVKLVEDGK